MAGPLLLLQEAGPSQKIVGRLMVGQIIKQRVNEDKTDYLALDLALEF